ncbi:MAG: hypothetical protein AAGA03_05980 [Planctomycetota bacterium]
MAGTFDLQTVWHQYREGNVGGVIDALTPYASVDTPDSETHSNQSELLQLLGLALHDQGKPFEAADTLERASLLTPISDAARIALASSYAQLRRIDLARELYLQLALGRRLDAELMLQVAAGLEAIDSPDLAMKVCEWITERDESVAQAYYDMGFYSARAGQPLYMTEALVHRALQLDPENIHYRVGLVSLLIQLDRKEEAIRALGKIDSLDIEKVECVSCLRRIADLLHEKGEAVLACVCDRRVDVLSEAKRKRDIHTSDGDVAR